MFQSFSTLINFRKLTGLFEAADEESPEYLFLLQSGRLQALISVSELAR